VTDARGLGSFDSWATLADTSAEAAGRVLAHRRTTRWWPLLVAAASLLIVVGVVTAVTRGTTPSSDPAPQNPPSPAPSVADGWRTEVWQDAHVRVPATWAWGGAPMRDFVEPGDEQRTQLLDCGASAQRSAEGKSFLNGDPSLPYVGRPIMQSDMCLVYDPASPPEPTSDSVWLGSPLEPGRERIGSYVRETVEVGGTTVTVTTREPGLRDRILATVGIQEGPCPASMTKPDQQVTVEASGDAMAVCAYGRQTRGGPADLVYATEIDARAAEDFVEAWQASMGAATADCFMPHSDEWIVLATATREFLVRFGPGCPYILSRGIEKLLTEDNTRQWAVDGVPVYVVGPYGGKGSTGGFFRGVLG